MTKIYTLLALITIFITQLNAQNLVPNPGFETQDTCPKVSEIRKAPPWNSPSLGTPDLFNKNCASQNFSGHNTTKGSAGIFVYSSFPDSREYIQARLLSPLTGGQKYCIGFWILRSNYKYSVSTIGAYFSVDSVRLQQTDNLPFTPNFETPSNTQLLTSTWTYISGTFTATGGEKFMIIGNFRDDATTVKSIVNPNATDSVSYYRIDDISVYACTGTDVDDIAADEGIMVYPNPAKDVLNIGFAAQFAVTENKVSVYDLLGNKMECNINLTDNNRYAINTEALSGGTYFVELNTTNERLVKKFLVIR